MNKSSKNILRLVSVVIVLVVVLMKLDIISSFFTNNGEFWMLIVAYGMLVFTLRS